MWETNAYPKWFKEYVVAFYNMRNLISIHTEDAKAKESEREMRRAKGRRR